MYIVTGGEVEEEGADHVVQEGSKLFSGNMFMTVMNKIFYPQ